MEVICLETEAFYAMVEQVVDRLKERHTAQDIDWIDSEEAMAILKISSKTTLQKLRDTGAIKFSQPMKKHILYYKPSLLNYLEKHAHDTF